MEKNKLGYYLKKSNINFLISLNILFIYFLSNYLSLLMNTLLALRLKGFFFLEDF